MKHHFAPWSTDTTTLGGLFKISLQPGDMFTKCTRCDVPVKMGGTRVTPQFWVDGQWSSKRPKCTGSK